MAALDREIDRLYQLPLSEFTRARDELAKQAPSGRAAIRRLQKPNAAAWAVNQLYWRDRAVYDALVAAAERLRAAQVASLGGKAADVARAEAAHAAARQRALERALKAAGDSGERVSAATRAAVNETLEALPSPSAEPPGRLTRPLKPMGFEALAGLLKGRAIARRRADVLPFRRPAKDQRARTDDRERAEAEARERAERQKAAVAKLAAQARGAAREERQASGALARARAALEKAEHDREAAARQLERAVDRLEALERAVREAERRAAQTAIARAAAEKELEDARRRRP